MVPAMSRWLNGTPDKLNELARRVACESSRARSRVPHKPSRSARAGTHFARIVDLRRDVGLQRAGPAALQRHAPRRDARQSRRCLQTLPRRVVRVKGTKVARAQRDQNGASQRGNGDNFALKKKKGGVLNISVVFAPHWWCFSIALSKRYSVGQQQTPLGVCVVNFDRATVHHAQYVAWFVSRSTRHVLGHR